MPVYSQSLAIDANFKEVPTWGFLVSKSISTNATNTTVAVPIFTLTGSVRISQLWGIVTTALGSNQTAAYWRLNDQTAQTAISLATGTTVSSMAAGSLLLRSSLVSVALVASNASAGIVTDPVAATAPDLFMPFSVTQKTGSVLTQIEYVYTTNQSPTTGAITFYAQYQPLTDTSKLIAA